MEFETVDFAGMNIFKLVLNNNDNDNDNDNNGNDSSFLECPQSKALGHLTTTKKYPTLY